MTHAKPEYTAADLEKVAPVDLEHFTKEDAFALGTIAGGVITEWGLSLAVQIIIGDDIVYRAKFGRTDAGNDAWLAGKAATAARFGVPSLLVRLQHDEAGTPFADRDDIDHTVMKASGGSIPIRVAGEIAATITTSGEPDVVDHETTAEALARYQASIA